VDNDSLVLSSLLVSEEVLQTGNEYLEFATDSDADAINDSETTNVSASYDLRLSAPNEVFKSGGVVIQWTPSDYGHTLTGSAGVGGPTVIVVSVSKVNGIWVTSTTLYGSVDHAHTATPPAEDVVTIPVNASVYAPGEATAFTSGLLNVLIEDDAPIAVADVKYASITTHIDPTTHVAVSDSNPTVAGNVLTNDHAGADGVGAVIFIAANGGQNVAVSSTGNTTIQGVYGSLSIDKTGAYTYQPTAAVLQTVDLTAPNTLKAYGDSKLPILSNGNLDTTMAPNATVDTHNATGGSSSKVGYGVADSQGPTTLDAGEALVVDLGKDMAGAISFSIGEANTKQTGANGIQWFAFDSTGSLVTSGTVGETSLSKDGTYTSGPIPLGHAIHYVVFEYGGSGSGYTLTDLSFVPPRGTDIFSYTMTDGDGNTSAANLTLTTNETITGTTGNDILSTGSGNDTLIGGAGDDTLTGGLGADVFKWSLGDQGSTTTPAIDHITDFSLSQKDVLNIGDLLQGESGTTSANNLGQFLNFGLVDGKLALLVDHDGSGFINSVNKGAFAATQKIVLDNYTGTGANDAAILASAKASFAAALFGDSAAHTDADILNKMLQTGALKTDI